MWSMKPVFPQGKVALGNNGSAHSKLQTTTRSVHAPWFYWSDLTSALTPPRCVSWRHQHCLLFMRLLTTYIQQDTFLITETPCLATCVNGFLHDCFHAQVNCPCFIRWDCVMYGSLWFRLFSVVVKIVWDCSNLDVIGSSALLRVFFVRPCSGRKQMELNWDSGFRETRVETFARRFCKLTVW